jgi:[protein-PII] uridylyltransferase
VLEARFLDGDVKLFDQLRARFDKEIVAKTASEFVAAKLSERDKRIKREGESRYLVEPNIKEGKGGLRDLNTLFWIAKYVYQVSDPHELVAAGLFSRNELLMFRRCEDFLWSVRCHLHFYTGRAEERLSFDFQKPIAERSPKTSAISPRSSAPRWRSVRRSRRKRSIAFWAGCAAARRLSPMLPISASTPTG